MGAFSKFFNVFRAKEAPSSHDRDALRMEDQRAEPVLHHGSSATGNVKQGHTGRAIYVLGPSSSGKSTLCDALARYLDLDRTRYVREVARTVMREQGFTRKDVDTYAMQQAIMTAQLKAEQKILERNEVSADADEGCVIMLSDRSAVDPIVYAATSRSPGAEDMRRKLREDKAFQSVLPFYRKSLFIVLQPVKEWIHDDGVRTLENPWIYNQRLFATLEELNIPYVMIGADLKDLDSRVAYVATFVY